jgi:phage tail sheath protein FI
MVTVTYPGVYIQELPSGVRTIVGVSTSNTAFVDYFLRGPVGIPTQVASFAEFQRRFGGLCLDSEASYGVYQYFMNGGQLATIVRLASGAFEASVELPTEEYGKPGKLVVLSVSPGTWSNNLQVSVSYPQPAASGSLRFNLFVQELVNQNVVNQESYYNLTMDPTDPNYAKALIGEVSTLISLDDSDAPTRPAATKWTSLSGGSPGVTPASDTKDWATLVKDALDGPLNTSHYNILCLPITSLFEDSEASAVLTAAQNACETARAFFLVDPPASITSAGKLTEWVAATGIQQSSSRAFSAIYFPRLNIADPLMQYRQRSVGPSGTLAGIYARTDANRGVWKAPAGTDAGLNGAQVNYVLTNTDSGTLNQQGLDALRNFPVFGNVVWGTRTLDGADQLASDYKYVPVRRLTSYIEMSLLNGTQWAVFEPNDEILWASLRLAVNNFMAPLAQRGAFYDYFVRCDATTTTQIDINNGVCNIIVGFAPVKPAEFIVIQIQQLAGQAAA